MAHFCLLVVTRVPDDVSEALRPFWDDDRDDRRQAHFVFVEDRYSDPDLATGRRGYWRNPIGKWDGWISGGRWEGLLRVTGIGAAADDAGNQCQARDLATLLHAEPGRLADVHALLVHGTWQDADTHRSSGREAGRPSCARPSPASPRTIG
jgi:hypothetical protein